MLHKPHAPMVKDVIGPEHRPVSDAEWRFMEPFVIETPRRPGRPPRNHRLVIDGIFWIACTGAPWRSLPDEFGNWGSVYRQFLRWTKSGLWEALLEALRNSSIQSSHPDVIDVYADVDRDTMTVFIEQAQLVALRPRSTQGRPRTFTY